jgi:hypothetical protein
MAGQTGVDDGDPAGLLDQVAVDQVGTDAVEVRCQLQRAISVPRTFSPTVAC